MEIFPSYAKFELDGFGDDIPDPSVRRIEMERGIPKQEIINTDVRKVLSGNIIFLTNADVVAFENWYFDTIKRVDQFQMRHPVTGLTIIGRFVGGKIGRLVPATGGFGVAQRSVEVEYMRYAT